MEMVEKISTLNEINDALRASRKLAGIIKNELKNTPEHEGVIEIVYEHAERYVGVVVPDFLSLDFLNKIFEKAKNDELDFQFIFNAGSSNGLFYINF